MDIQKFGMRLAENSLSVLSSEWVGLSDMILKPNDSWSNFYYSYS